ncbi:cytochrome c-type biogenesis protein [Rouxiella chamberiensis]|uniref:cytochrome c-type biogenesis protein n=1 Tax=Rouxiella chamberiensis TaxID=1513468 RepID=UPI0005D3CD34|nr:cytochrome c-type biogenesis protein [Rouxiella chamberiensis]
MRILALFLGMVLSFSVFAAIDTYQFTSPQQEQQYRQLTEQLRCPKCQNTNIAASDSIIAADMRTKVYQLLNQGQSSKQIIDYMVARYGNFVTYEPPVTPSTLILWVGPALFVLVGALVIILRARRRPGEQMSSQEQQRLARLLGESDGKES